MAGSFQILLHKNEDSKNVLVLWGWYLYTIGVILGAFLAKETYGYYWVWDLKETLSLFTLLGYFGYITFEKKIHPKARRVVIAGCLLLALLTLLIPTFTYSYHSLLDFFAS
jgi:hypothetical protein